MAEPDRGTSPAASGPGPAPSTAPSTAPEHPWETEGLGGDDDIGSAPPGRLAADAGSALEERPEVQEAMVDDTVAPGLVAPDAGTPDPQTPLFQEPGAPPADPS